MNANSVELPLSTVDKYGEMGYAQTKDSDHYRYIDWVLLVARRTDSREGGSDIATQEQWNRVQETELCI